MTDKEKQFLELVLVMAQDWLETVDPDYAKEILGFHTQPEEIQQALNAVKLLSQDSSRRGVT